MEKKEAVNFLECLAKGRNPFDGYQISEESILNDVRFVRMFYELRDYIVDNIEEEREPKVKKMPFVLKTKEGIIDRASNMSNFIDRINQVNLEENMKRFTRTPVMNWLIENGYLVVQEDKKCITAKGNEAGIYYDYRFSSSGREYEVIMYPPEFLRYLLDSIESGEIA